MQVRSVRLNFPRFPTKDVDLKKKLPNISDFLGVLNDPTFFRHDKENRSFCDLLSHISSFMFGGGNRLCL